MLENSFAKPGLVFRVHPFQGKHSELENLAPEHLTAGKRYYLVYTYHLDEEPHGDSDLIGLTRCAVHEDTLRLRKSFSKPSADRSAAVAIGGKDSPRSLYKMFVTKTVFR